MLKKSSTQGSFHPSVDIFTSPVNLPLTPSSVVQVSAIIVDGCEM